MPDVWAGAAGKHSRATVAAGDSGGAVTADAAGAATAEYWIRYNATVAAATTQYNATIAAATKVAAGDSKATVAAADWSQWTGQVLRKEGNGKGDGDKGGKGVEWGWDGPLGQKVRTDGGI